MNVLILGASRGIGPDSPGWVKTDMGGARAPLELEPSVGAMRRTIAGLTRKHKGAFLNHDGRRFSGW
jgi:hypothetical protein